VKNCKSCTEWSREDGCYHMVRSDEECEAHYQEEEQEDGKDTGHQAG
jgi:hypothetical protein